MLMIPTPIPKVLLDTPLALPSDVCDVEAPVLADTLPLQKVLVPVPANGIVVDVASADEVPNGLADGDAGPWDVLCVKVIGLNEGTKGEEEGRGEREGV